MLPRIPLVESKEDFWAFSKAGRNLANLHLHYEEEEAASGLDIKFTGEIKDEYEYFSVEKRLSVGSVIKKNSALLGANH